MRLEFADDPLGISVERHRPEEVEEQLMELAHLIQLFLRETDPVVLCDDTYQVPGSSTLIREDFTRNDG